MRKKIVLLLLLFVSITLFGCGVRSEKNKIEDVHDWTPGSKYQQENGATIAILDNEDGDFSVLINQTMVHMVRRQEEVQENDEKIIKYAYSHYDYQSETIDFEYYVLENKIVVEQTDTWADYIDDIPLCSGTYEYIGEHTVKTLQAQKNLDNEKDVISYQEAIKRIGEPVDAKGTVISVRKSEDANGKPWFLNIGKDYPDPERLTVVIFEDVYKDFAFDVASLEGTEIRVRGTVKEYDGCAQIIISDARYIINAKTNESYKEKKKLSPEDEYLYWEYQQYEELEQYEKQHRYENERFW